MGKRYVAMIILLSLAKVSAFRVMVWMYGKLCNLGTCMRASIGTCSQSMFLLWIYLGGARMQVILATY